MKIAVIGVNGKELTYNVVKALADSPFSLELVALREKKKKYFQIALNYIKTFGILKFLKKAYLRKENLTLNIKSFCAVNKIRCIAHENINSTEIANALKEINPDVIVLAGPPIVKEHIFEIANMYTINVHRSILPKYAGLEAIFWALYHNEKEIGATIHTVEKGIDAGDIIYQETKRVGPQDDVETLTSWYVQNAPTFVIKALHIIADPAHQFKKQDFSKRSYFSRPTQAQREELNKRLNK